MIEKGRHWIELSFSLFGRSFDEELNSKLSRVGFYELNGINKVIKFIKETGNEENK